MSSDKCTGVDLGHEPRPCGPQEAFLSLWLWPFVYASQTLSLSLISAMIAMTQLLGTVRWQHLNRRMQTDADGHIGIQAYRLIDCEFARSTERYCMARA